MKLKELIFVHIFTKRKRGITELQYKFEVVCRKCLNSEHNYVVIYS